MRATKVQATSKAMTALLTDHPRIEANKSMKEYRKVEMRAATPTEILRLQSYYQDRRSYG
jgi:hypothetical protein